MPKFRLLSSEALDLFVPADKSRDSYAVEAGAEVKVPGDIASETEDAYVVGVDANARAWSKTLWALVDDKPATKEK